MIARLVGTLVSRDGDRAIVDVHGVGYAVHGPLRDLEAWATAEAPVEVFVHTDVREDAIVLYGFSDDVDRRAFERLRAVNGVGPKTALAALDTLGLEALVTAVATDDVAGLCRVPGVGKKLAQRLALELKEKLPVAFSPDATAPVPRAAAKADPLDLALARLGYTRSEIVRAHRALEEEGLGAEAAIEDRLRASLRVLSRVGLMSDAYNEDPALRPRRLDEYVGQTAITANLRVYIRAALQRGEALDHVLLAGPPGLGKTSLAYIISEELGVEVRTASGPTLERGGDLAAILGLGEREVLFIDEIHRMHRAVEEVLYPALEDFEIDVVLGSGPGAQSVKLPLPRFTLVGATTRSGLLSAPLRARFGIHCTFDFYTAAELEQIVRRSAERLALEVTPEACKELAARSRGTPRIANRLLRRVRDFAEVEHDGTVDTPLVKLALERLGIDQVGLNKMDLRILHTIAVKFDGGPVGLDTMAAAIGESAQTLEEAYEPFLIQQGLLMRTPRGRVITRRGRAHLGLPEDDDPQGSLL